METLEIIIARGEITIPNLVLEWKPNNIAFVQIFRFGDNIKSDWEQTVNQIVKREAQGLVIDVRNNPGGYLDGAVIIGSEFFNKGEVVIKKSASGGRKGLGLDHQGVLTEIPLVVLINKGSASASEILAGAIQVRKRGVLVGEKSFGKGTVQESLELTGGSGLHVTIADWLLPNGQSVDGEGLTPDVPVEQTEEDQMNGIGKQLEKALELLR